VLLRCARLGCGRPVEGGGECDGHPPDEIPVSGWCTYDSPSGPCGRRTYPDYSLCGLHGGRSPAPR
jgi:hypothetical protein